MSFVLDSSVAIAWQMPDEGSQNLAALFDRFLNQGALVPSLWRLEVANTLLVAQRRGRIDADFRKAAIADFMMMPVTVDQETDIHAWRDTIDLADRFALTVYDATYLELARRRGLPLATLDKALRAAAERAHVAVEMI